MKTIKINGVELRVTRETTDTTVEPVHRFGVVKSVTTDQTFTVRQVIDAIAPGLDISIAGSPVAIRALFAAPSDPHSLIQRALSALGYVVGDHAKDVAQFSQWVDNFSKFPQTIDAEKLWTDAILARLNSPEPPMTNETIDEASAAAQRVVIQRMRLFPPVQKTGLDDGPALQDAHAELLAWRSAAELHGFNTPNQLVDAVFYDPNLPNELFGWKEAAKQRGWNSPLDLRGRTAADDAELDEWRSAAKLMGFASPKELADSWRETFGQFVDRKIVSEWQDATGCHDPGIAKERIKQLRAGYNSADAERSQLKRDAKQREQAWVNATDRHCPGDAKQRIDDLRMQVEMQAETIRTWKKATGADSPEFAINTIGASFDSWKEATGCANAFQAQKKIAELESKLLSYASEIDALRKVAQATKPTEVEVELGHGTPLTANGKTIGVVYNPERELLKVRAELQSKCREAQTAKERADENAREMVKRGALLDKIAEALGCDFNHESLPEHVADMKRAYDNVNDCLVGPDNLVNETKEIASILVSQIKDAGIESAAGAIAGRSVSLSASWAKTMQAREILGASPGESVVEAAKRVMEKLARAIIPLSKPEKVEPGQRWAFVMKATSGPEDGNAYLAGRFRNAWGNHYGALTDDIRTGFYLGT